MWLEPHKRMRKCVRETQGCQATLVNELLSPSTLGVRWKIIYCQGIIQMKVRTVTSHSGLFDPPQFRDVCLGCSDARTPATAVEGSRPITLIAAPREVRAQLPSFLIGRRTYDSDGPDAAWSARSDAGLAAPRADAGAQSLLSGNAARVPRPASRHGGLRQPPAHAGGEARLRTPPTAVPRILGIPAGLVAKNRSDANYATFYTVAVLARAEEAALRRPGAGEAGESGEGGNAGGASDTCQSKR